MLRNFIKISIRQILRHKIHSFINIFGLTIGMVSFILIFIWIKEEFSYDKFHDKKDNIYQLSIKHQSGILDSNVPYALAPLLQDKIPGIKDYSRIFRLSYITPCALKYQDNSAEVKFYVDDICLVDSGFLKMFSYPLIYGNVDNALSDQNNIVISKQISERYFGSENPLGKILNLNNGDDFVITGVLEIPFKTHIKINCLIPLGNDLSNDWNWRDPSYILLNDHTDIQDFTNEIATIMKDHAPYPTDGMVVGILPIYDSYLSFGRMKYIYIFSIVSFFILFIAAINYINITMANSWIRIKELGIRKIYGAGKAQLMSQILLESISLSLISLFLSLVIIEIILPVFNSTFNKELKIGYLDNPGVLLFLILLAFSYGLLAGFLPAFLLTSRKLLTYLRSSVFINGRKSKFKTVSVLIQIIISILLISSTLTMYRQYNFMKNSPLGFDTEHIISLSMNQQIGMKFLEYINKLKQYSDIKNVTAGQSLPFNEDYKTGGINWPGKDPELNSLFRYSITLNNYIETFNMQIVDGRSFSQNYESDNTNYIINEEAAKYMSLDNPVGEKISLWNIEGEIIGVVKNFHHVPLNKEIMPHIFTIHPNNLRSLKHIFIKINSQNISGAIAYIEEVTKNFAPDFPVDIKFIDSDKNQLYKSEQTIGKLITAFAFIAIFISCLGIFGLAKFNTEQRTKEIGIRKVIGASTKDIILLLNWDISKIVLLGILIAVPIAFVLMQFWLNNFAYRIDIELWILILASLIALFSALFSIINVTIKASLNNPVSSLKYE